MHKSEQQLIPTNTVSYLVCKINAHSSNTNTAGPGLITDRSFKLPDSNRHILPGVQGEHPQHQHQCLVSHYCMMVDSGRQSLPDVSDEHPHHQHKHSRVWSHITLFDGRFFRDDTAYLVCRVNTHSINTSTEESGHTSPCMMVDSSRHSLPGVQGEQPQQQYQCSRARSGRTSCRSLPGS